MVETEPLCRAFFNLTYHLQSSDYQWQLHISPVLQSLLGYSSKLVGFRVCPAFGPSTPMPPALHTAATNSAEVTMEKLGLKHGETQEIHATSTTLKDTDPRV